MPFITLIAFYHICLLTCIVAQMKFYITVSQIGFGWKEKLFRTDRLFSHENAFLCIAANMTLQTTPIPHIGQNPS